MSLWEKDYIKSEVEAYSIPSIVGHWAPCTKSAWEEQGDAFWGVLEMLDGKLTEKVAEAGYQIDESRTVEWRVTDAHADYWLRGLVAVMREQPVLKTPLQDVEESIVAYRTNFYDEPAGERLYWAGKLAQALFKRDRMRAALREGEQ